MADWAYTGSQHVGTGQALLSVAIKYNVIVRRSGMFAGHLIPNIRKVVPGDRLLIGCGGVAGAVFACALVDTPVSPAKRAPAIDGAKMWELWIFYPAGIVMAF